MITGVILTHNEEINIGNCIAALRPHVQELILIDTESTDRTVELAAPLVDRILSHPNVPNFDAVRNIAIPVALYDWLWFVDADEFIPHVTGQIVRELLSTRDTEFEAIRIPFKTYFCGRWMQHCGWWPGYTSPRVLKRGHFEFSPTLHGGVRLQGREILLAPDPNTGVEHRGPRSVAHYLEKCNRYTTTESLQLAKRGATWNWRDAHWQFAQDLWLHYEYHNSRLDGDRGWIHTWLSAQYRWLSIAKLLDHGRTEEDHGGSSSVPENLNIVIDALREDLAKLRATRPICPLSLSVRLDFSESPIESWHLLKELAATYRPTRCKLIAPVYPVLPTRDEQLLFLALCSGELTDYTCSITRPTSVSLPVDESAVVNLLLCSESYTSTLTEWPVENDAYNEIWTDSNAVRDRLVCLGAAPERIRATPDTEGSLEVALRTTEECLAPLPSPPKKSDAVQVRWEGEFFANHSFANVNEQIAKRLAGLQTIELSLIRKHGPFLGDRHLLPNADRHHTEYRSVAANLFSNGKEPDVVVRHAFPPDWSKPATGRWVHVQPWEFGVLPISWRKALIEEVDEIWVMSRYVEEVYRNSDVPAEKLRYIPWGIDPAVFHPGTLKRTLATEKTFRFLYVGGLIHRKGFDLVLAAYLAEFKNCDDVALVVKDVGTKTFYSVDNYAEQVRRAINDPRQPTVLSYDREMTPGQLASLYATCDCLVAPYRGEGFGLPILEAMAVGLCPIVPDSGPILDYTDANCSIRLPSQRMPIELGADVPNATVIETGIDDLRAAMRTAFTNRADTARRGALASQKVHQEFTWDKTVSLMAERLEALADRDQNQRVGVASMPSTVRLTVVILSKGNLKSLAFSLSAMRPIVDEIVVLSNEDDESIRTIAAENGARACRFDALKFDDLHEDRWALALVEGEWLTESAVASIVPRLNAIGNHIQCVSLQTSGGSEVRLAKTAYFRSLVIDGEKLASTVDFAETVKGHTQTLIDFRKSFAENGIRDSCSFGRLEKAVLIQLATGRHTDYMQVTRPLHERYCQRHGLDYWSLQGSPVIGKRSAWGKLPLMLAAMELGYREIIWIDADALIVRPAVDLRLHCPSHLGLVKHPNPWHWNTGVMLATSGPECHEFLTAISSMAENDSAWMEQKPINELLAGARYQHIVTELELGLNSVPGFAEAADPVIVAAHGMPHTLRLKILSDAAVKASALYDAASSDIRRMQETRRSVHSY